MTLSKRCLNVTTQLRPFQIDSWAWAAPYPNKAAIPTTRNTCKNAVPGTSVRPERQAAKMLTTKQYKNHWIRFFPIAGGPLGSTVNKPTGPRFIFSIAGADFISLNEKYGKK